MTESDPLHQWKGAFGADYMARNVVDEPTLQENVTAFGRALDQSGSRGEIRSVLEVGANIGINLFALQRLLPGAKLSALEPNPAACERLRAATPLGLTDLHQADAYHIPAPDGAYDLTFTKGVLIHVPPSRLLEAMREIVRVSRRYVLCAEYFAHQPTEVSYRGNTGMLWKRDFGREYLREHPGLAVRGYGFWWNQEFPHLDDITWWMFEKV
jgi:pseudaminic acid biosynthesis-associated methylase